ncbi:MAG TPA: MerR family transcriptional regulator [Bdellovibrionota bacterium]|nr:MerR family transcriptional regulator [Bdellovibrionota bacterium]
MRSEHECFGLKHHFCKTLILPLLDVPQGAVVKCPPMAYFRIKEAAEKVGVQPHVLRFWESQFPTLKPSKTSRGQRLYSIEDIDNFLKIKHLLYNEGYSIPGAKKYLKDEKSKGKASKQLEDAIGKEVLREVADSLRGLQDLLKEF